MASKSKLNKLDKFIEQNGDILMTYLRGSIIWATVASQNPDDAKSRGSYLVKNHVRSFFVLDCNTGYLYFFKKTTQEKPTKIIHLQGGVISDSEEIFEDPINGEKIPAFELSLKKRTYIIVPEYAIDYDLTLKEFSSCVLKNRPKGHYRKKVAKGAMSVAKIPWNVVRMVTFSLEKIRQPSNVISGLLRGTTVLIGSILSGVAGIVIEPIKGAKKKGLKGATIGVGKGLLGLICKPVAGGIDMVTYTTRGIGNTPKTIYLGAGKLFKRKGKKIKINYKYPAIRPYVPDENGDDDQSDNEIYIGEDEEGSIYVDKNELKKALIEYNVIDHESLDLISDNNDLNINKFLKTQKSKWDQKWKNHEDREEDEKYEMDLLHKNLKRRVKDKNHDLKSGEYDYAYYEQSNMNNMGFPSKVSIDGDQDHMDIIYDLIRKKKLKRIEQVEPTLSEFHTAKDHISSYASSSILDDDLGLYMVAQREVREHGDESSCSDSDCSEESKTLLGSEWLKDSESYSFITPDYQYDENWDIRNDKSPNIKIQVMGQVKNKFIPKDKKKNKNKKREIKSEVVCVPKLDPEIEAKNRKKNQIVTVAKRAKPLTRTDDYRIFDSHPDGGFALVDQEVISKLRNIAKEVVKRVGSQLLRGKLNLTSVSFPIRCMGKWSHLEALTSIMKVFPYYLTAAAYQTDPVERMKWYMAAMISTHTAVHSFDKPLNPILGETYVCEWEDGSIAYAEQTSHKPPVTHAQFYGPDECYVLSMYSSFSAKAGFNSITLDWLGNKTWVFKDGTSIHWNQAPGDFINHTFIGTLNHQFTGRLEYVDRINNVKWVYEPGKQRIQDYIEGYIEKDGVIVSTLSGNYCGYLDFDDVRYWDARDTVKFMIKQSEEKVLPSDSRYRSDLIAYIAGDDDAAQVNKEMLEQDQRDDAKLRGHK